MKKSLYLFFAVVTVFALALAACGTPATPAPTEAPVVVEPTAVPPTAVPPTPEPTAIPFGSADTPVILALAPSANTQELIAGGDAIAAKLSELTGYTVKATVPTNYAALVEAMGSGNAHIGFLPTVPYIVAYYKGYATIGMVTLRSGADHYAFEIISNVERKDKDGNPMFTSYYDATTGKNTADAATALAQFNGKRPCYTDPLSSSGYLVPAGFFASNEIKTLAGAWVQGHPTVVKSVYLSPNGEICDFGTVYVDARTNVTDFADVNDKVQILWVSDPIIPNDTISFATSVPEEARQKLTDAMLEIASTEDGLALLKNGGYSIGGLKQVDDSFFDEYRVFLESIGFDINSYK